ncbi:sensor histidine kinase [Planotetraspora silvatica]|uniref:sensor histidine kinase n=1 Tax=Planotetraspora silvatica TaxID=234614 RepID=UPI001951E41C|nr:histidine kinase [Planotetraspora silvatica]
MNRERTIRLAIRIAVVVVFLIALLQSDPGPRLSGASLANSLLSVCFVAAAFLALQRHDRMTARAIVASYGMVASALLLHLLRPEGPAISAVFVAIGVIALRLPLAFSLPAAVTALAGLAVGTLEEGKGLSWDVIAIGGVIYLLAYVRRTTLAARAAEDREAVLAERARIARDIHDILAHSLSAQIVHLEGARLLLRADRSDEALERVELARDMAKQGLEETRRAITALREDMPPLVDAVSTLTGEFETATGVGCELTMAGDRRRLDPEAELAIIRTTQEALTNVRRHAPGVAPGVRLIFGPETCSLEVTNELAASPGTPGSGYGLVGMRERAELLGGHLEAGERDGVFRVRLEVPA